MKRIFAEQFVLFVRQALYFGRQFAIELPETLRREGSGHSGKTGSALRRSAFLKGPELTSADVRLHSLEKR